MRATPHSALTPRYRIALVVATVAAVLLAVPATLARAWVGGDIAPDQVISGQASGLNTPNGIAYDSAGNLYVANTGSNSITVYAPGADGDAAPIKTLVGPATGLSNPQGVAIDSDDTLYVANTTSQSVEVFNAGWASGDTAPDRVIAGASTSLAGPAVIAVDSLDRIYVSNGAFSGPGAQSVVQFAADADGDAAPQRVLPGLVTPAGIAFDASGNMAVAQTNLNSVSLYPADWDQVSTPLKTLSGPDSGLTLPGYITFDADGNLIVAAILTSTVFAYAADWTDGDNAPIKTLSGPNTQLSLPLGLATIGDGGLAVANGGSAAVLIWNAVPPAPVHTKLKVTAREVTTVKANRTSILVHKTRTNGDITNVVTKCKLNGTAVTAAKAKKLCAVKITRTATQSARALPITPLKITATPKSREHLTVTVRITARNGDADPVTWSKTWKVNPTIHGRG